MKKFKQKFEDYCNATKGKPTLDFEAYKASGLSPREFEFFYDNFKYIKYLFICEMGLTRTYGKDACSSLFKKIENEDYREEK